MTKQKEIGSRYALSEMKLRRRIIASEIEQLKNEIAMREAAMAHVDGVLAMLDPSLDPAALPDRYSPRRAEFKQGELGRAIIGAMRKIARPATKDEITRAVMVCGGFAEENFRLLSNRIRFGLAYLEKTERAKKIGRGTVATWAQVPK